MVTRARLKQVLYYHPESGDWIWRERMGVRGVPGTQAGTRSVGGYWIVVVDGYGYQAGRLAWFYMKGRWPRNTIDHKDQNKLNNAWSNLREATLNQQQHNRVVRKDSKTGVKGVMWSPLRNKYKAVIGLHSTKKCLGFYDTTQEAHAAYLKAAAILHGEFAHG